MFLKYPGISLKPLPHSAQGPTDLHFNSLPSEFWLEATEFGHSWLTATTFNSNNDANVTFGHQMLLFYVPIRGKKKNPVE